MSKLKRITAAIVAILLTLTFVSCRPKDESAFVYKSGEKEVKIRSAIYLCYLIDARSEWETTVDEQLEKDGKDNANVDYEKATVDEMSRDEWIKSEAKQSCDEYAFVELEFERLGLEISTDELDYYEYYAQSNWDNEQYRMNEFYENNGVSFDSYLSYFTNSLKREKIFDFYYGEETEHDEDDHEGHDHEGDEHEDETTAAVNTDGGTTVAQTTTEPKKVDPEIEKLHGSKRPAEKKIKEAFVKNFLLVNKVSKSLTDDTGAAVSDVDKKKLKKEIQGYADDFNAGKIKFDKIKSVYPAAQSTETGQTEAKDADGELLYSAKANEIVNGTDTASDFFSSVAKSKLNTAKIYEGTDSYSLIIRKNINSDSYYWENYSGFALKIICGDEFDKMIEEGAKKLECDTNEGAVGFYSPEKIKDPETSAAATAEATQAE